MRWNARQVPPMLRRRVGTVVLLTVLGVGCGTDPSARSPSDEQGLLATTSVAALPAPDAAQEARALFAAMPDQVGGATRTGYGDEARYRQPDGTELGIEALDVDDVLALPSGEAVGTAIRDLVAQPRACPPPTPPACVRGGDGTGGKVMVWVSDETSLIYAAVAPSDDALDDLVEAWRRAGTTVTAGS